MSKYANLPGYDTSSKTVYGDNIDDNMSMPEEDRDWKGSQAMSNEFSVLKFFDKQQQKEKGRKKTRRTWKSLLVKQLRRSSAFAKVILIRSEM